MRRNKDNQWLPKYVHRGKTSYEFRPTKGEYHKLMRRPADGIETEEVKAKVWAAYKDLIEVKEYTVKDLITDYHNSTQFKRKEKRTKEDELYYRKKILAVFGKMKPEVVRPVHIRQFMDKVGEKHPVSANRHHSYLSYLFGWAYERDLCKMNPAKDVKKFPEISRDRYVEQDEFDFVYNLALNGGSPYIAHMMKIAYLCRMRPSEARTLTEKHILPEGIFVERGKGSENEITRWSPALKQAVNAARAMHPDAPVHVDRPLFHDKHGVMISRSAYKSAWQRVINKAQKEGLSDRFTFHDLKARGITNHHQKHGGHKTKKMERVYDRKPGLIDATE